MSNFRSKLQSAMEKLGRNNGHAPPPSQDPFDTIAHEYYVGSIGESYFKKRRDEAKKNLIENIGSHTKEVLKASIDKVQKLEESMHQVLSHGQHYDLSAHIKIGGAYLDEPILRVELLKTLTTEQVNAAFDKARKRRAPSVTYNIAEKGELLE